MFQLLGRLSLHLMQELRLENDNTATLSNESGTSWTRMCAADGELISVSEACD